MKRIIISLDDELLKEIDEANVFISRAEFVRDCVRSKLSPQKEYSPKDDLLYEAGLAIETIRGYVAMGNGEEAEKHLVTLSRYLLDQISQSIKKANE